MTIKLEKPNWNEFEGLDFSSIDQFLSCGEQFRRVKSGEKQPPSVALVEGTSTHLACSSNNLNKRDKGKDLQAKKLVDISLNSFEEETKKPEFKDKVKILPEEKDDVYKRAKVWFPEYLSKHASLIEPEWVEQPIHKQVQVEGVNFVLSGVIDLTNRKGKEVVDYKTTSQIKSQNEADSSIQLSLYSMFSNKPNVSFCCFVKTKNPYVAKVPSVRTPAHYQWALLVAKRVIEAVRKESFPFANPSTQNWRCSEKFCGFWSSCRGKYETVGAQKLENKK